MLPIPLPLLLQLSTPTPSSPLLLAAAAPKVERDSSSSAKLLHSRLEPGNAPPIGKRQAPAGVARKGVELRDERGRRGPALRPPSPATRSVGAPCSPAADQVSDDAAQKGDTLLRRAHVDLERQNVDVDALD